MNNHHIRTKSLGHKSQSSENWPYLEQEDTFLCPNGQRVPFKRYQTRQDAYDFKRQLKIYECEDCSTCMLRSQCMKGKEPNRTLQKIEIGNILKSTPNTSFQKKKQDTCIDNEKLMSNQRSPIWRLIWVSLVYLCEGETRWETN